MQKSLSSLWLQVFITGENSPEGFVCETDVGQAEEEGTEFIPSDSHTFLEVRQFVV